MIEQESEETMRTFVRRVKVAKIRDVKSEMTHEIVSELNRRFQHFGVYFESVLIRNIIIPEELRKALGDATMYDVLLQNEIKKQENNELCLNNAENKILTQQKLD